MLGNGFVLLWGCAVLVAGVALATNVRGATDWFEVKANARRTWPLTLTQYRIGGGVMAVIGAGFVLVSLAGS
ncbi:hypothetical protein ACIQPT_01080 [Streptomyces sp. NPDC091289]|uniref:hypothetical protein n=1 Tax=Streptomyces sp. NPDC091289 TaxID=3365989 RepID=UPI0038094689